MYITLADASARLLELVLRAEAGEEILLTEDGRLVAHIVGLRAMLTPAERQTLLDEIDNAVRNEASGELAG